MFYILGLPKGAIITHASLVTSCEAVNERLVSTTHTSDLLGIRPQFRLLEKKIVRTETYMARFDWLLFTYK